MANLHPNSTNYVHSYEPNTNDLHMAMGYDAQGMPVLRVDRVTFADDTVTSSVRGPLSLSRQGLSATAGFV